MDEQTQEQLVQLWIELQIQERKLSEVKVAFEQLAAKSGLTGKFKLRMEPVIEGTLTKKEP